MEQAIPRKVHIKTFGCQMNVYDSGKMLALLRHDGFEPCEDWHHAHLVIINTCSVREKPEHKLLSYLGNLLRKKRDTGLPMVAVAGCMAQHDGARLFQQQPQVDLVLGPDAVPRIRELVRAAEHRRVLDNRFLEVADYPFVQELPPQQERQVSGLVTIQKGCDNHCTYCIVPFARGPEVSRPAEQVEAELRALVERGVRDVTLIGQNVNAWGHKLPGEPSFAQLLRRVAAVPGLARLRFTTSHPRDLGLGTAACFAELPALASHLHLPVQAGADRVLRRMGRGYDRARYLQVARWLREARPDISLTTDFIVGFPGESEADFQQTLSLLEQLRFDASFSFCYSPRPHTAARRLPPDDAVPEDESKDRLRRLQALQSRIQLENNRALEGQVLEVLVEGPSRKDPRQVMGRSSCFRAVNLAGPSEWIGELMPVRITRAHAHSLQGEVLF